MARHVMSRHASRALASEFPTHQGFLALDDRLTRAEGGADPTAAWLRGCVAATAGRCIVQRLLSHRIPLPAQCVVTPGGGEGRGITRWAAGRGLPPGFFPALRLVVQRVTWYLPYGRLETDVQSLVDRGGQDIPCGTPGNKAPLPGNPYVDETFSASIDRTPYSRDNALPGAGETSSPFAQSGGARAPLSVAHTKQHRHRPAQTSADTQSPYPAHSTAPPRRDPPRPGRHTACAKRSPETRDERRDRGQLVSPAFHGKASRQNSGANNLWGAIGAVPASPRHDGLEEEESYVLTRHETPTSAPRTRPNTSPGTSVIPSRRRTATLCCGCGCEHARPTHRSHLQHPEVSGPPRRTSHRDTSALENARLSGRRLMPFESSGTPGRTGPLFLSSSLPLSPAPLAPRTYVALHRAWQTYQVATRASVAGLIRLPHPIFARLLCGTQQHGSELGSVDRHRRGDD
ncbi:hypothetical protein JHW43_007359 [Diplocarpon mali]|nr:hypothetical protein JHW43_007359 [Diplocarpon mali]